MIVACGDEDRTPIAAYMQLRNESVELPISWARNIDDEVLLIHLSESSESECANPCNRTCEQEHLEGRFISVAAIPQVGGHAIDQSPISKLLKQAFTRYLPSLPTVTLGATRSGATYFTTGFVDIQSLSEDTTTGKVNAELGGSTKVFGEFSARLCAE